MGDPANAAKRPAVKTFSNDLEFVLFWPGFSDPSVRDGAFKIIDSEPIVIQLIKEMIRKMICPIREYIPDTFNGAHK